MQFLYFPYVVRKLIVKQMKYSELIVLSLCSSITFQSIRNVVWRDIERIQFRSMTGYVEVIAMGKHELQQTFLRIEEILSNGKNEEKSGKLSISGMKADYQISSDQPLILSHKYGPQGPICEAVHLHLLFLFGCHLNFTLKSFGKTNDPFHIPKLKNIKMTTLHFDGVVETKKLNEYFSRSPDHEIIQMSLIVNGLLDSKSPLFNTRHLVIRTEENLMTQVMQNFNGKTLISLDAKLTDNTIIRFLRKWISNESFRELEAIEFESHEQIRLNLGKIQRNVLIKQLDSPLPVFNHTVKEFDDRKIYDSLIELASPMYVVRDCDGVVASLEITENSFMFVVSNLTEKQIKELCY